MLITQGHFVQQKGHLGLIKGYFRGDLVKQRCILANQKGIRGTQVHFWCDSRVKPKHETASLRLSRMLG